MNPVYNMRRIRQPIIVGGALPNPACVRSRADIRPPVLAIEFLKPLRNQQASGQKYDDD
jgi:hypothetical protein